MVTRTRAGSTNNLSRLLNARDKGQSASQGCTHARTKSTLSRSSCLGPLCLPGLQKVLIFLAHARKERVKKRSNPGPGPDLNSYRPRTQEGEPFRPKAGCAQERQQALSWVNRIAKAAGHGRLRRRHRPVTAHPLEGREARPGRVTSTCLSASCSDSI